MNYQKLFNYLNQEFDISPLESDMREIVDIVNEMLTESRDDAENDWWYKGFFNEEESGFGK